MEYCRILHDTHMYHHSFELSFRYRNHTLISHNFLIRTYRLLLTCFQLPRSLVQNLQSSKLLRLMSHNSSCYDPNINFSCPKKTHCYVPNSSQRDPKSTSPVPKHHLVQSQNSSCHDHKSTSPVPKSDLILSHILSCYDLILSSPVPKVTWFCLIIRLIMTQHQLLLSQKVTSFVP
jgi:hypothetical protein